MLNFDPYRWNAEHSSGQPVRSVATVATVAGVRPENEKSKSAERAATVATTATLPASPSSTLREWRRHLAALDDYRAPAGIAADRWRQLISDARWLGDRHGEAAIALGWTASDLFGIVHGDGWGGLADRLHGARCLILTEAVAHWRTEELEGWLWRRTLTPKPFLWRACDV